MEQSKILKTFHQNRKVFLLTSQPYAIFMSECPYIDGVIIDKRLPRWNLFYLNNLKKTLKSIILQKFSIYKILVEQNSIKDLSLKMLSGLPQKQH